MQQTLTAYLDDLHEHGRRHDAEKADRLERLRNVEPDTARLLALLVHATSARRLLEIGTSNGYSTLWLAEAVRGFGGHVTSVDIDEVRSAQAREHLSEVGLERFAEVRTEDAAETLAACEDEAFDMIFLDAERPSYPGYWPDLVRLLEPGGLLAVDNVLSHADELAGFRALVDADHRVVQALAPTGAGLLLIVRTRPLAA
jgi:predicted O-methyltransferase YrrM